MIKFKKPKFYSLKIGIITAIILGILVGVLVYGVTFDISEYIRVNYYATDQARAARERRLSEDFQNYVTNHELSSNDIASIRRFVEQKKYIYLLLNDGGNFYVFSGLYGDTTTVPLFFDPLLGGSVEYPSEEEMRDYALASGFVSVEMADGAAFLSIADFSEYFYRDFAEILSIVLAMFALALVITLYFFRVIKRITRLAAEVNVVADGDMSHSITPDGHDEISRLSSDVENMRTVILQTLESERRARAANTELVTSMSHDIRTPLTVLIGYLDIMKACSRDEVMDEYIRSSEKTAMRLKELSDDMFRYLLVFGDSAEPCEIEPYDCTTLVEQLLSEHIVLLRENGYDVRFTSDDSTGVSIFTSAPELMRIIDNLFSNIRKYADKQCPVCISVTAEESQVTIGFSNRISGDSRPAESTGIGLKTCTKIAELISCDFSYSKSDDVFASNIVLKAQRSDKV